MTGTSAKRGRAPHTLKFNTTVRTDHPMYNLSGASIFQAQADQARVHNVDAVSIMDTSIIENWDIEVPAELGLFEQDIFLAILTIACSRGRGERLEIDGLSDEQANQLLISTQQGRPFLRIKTTRYEILEATAKKSKGGKVYERMVKALWLLSKVRYVYNGLKGSNGFAQRAAGNQHLLAYDILSPTEEVRGNGEGEKLDIVLNARLAHAAIAKGSKAAIIDMTDYWALRNKLSRLLFPRLCAFISPGETNKKLTLRTASNFGYAPAPPPRRRASRAQQKAESAAHNMCLSRRLKTIKEALREIGDLNGWSIKFESDCQSVRISRDPTKRSNLADAA